MTFAYLHCFKDSVKSVFLILRFKYFYSNFSNTDHGSHNKTVFVNMHVYTVHPFLINKEKTNIIEGNFHLQNIIFKVNQPI